MGYDENYVWAQKAVAFVKAYTPLGAANKARNPAEMIRAKGARWAIGDNLDPYLNNLQADSPGDGLANIRKTVELGIAFNAALTIRERGGNCSDQAGLAFIYLRDNKVFPIDYMNKPDFFLKFGGHAFVVIGRKSGSDPLRPETWGDDAVVCDPHQEEKAFPPRDLVRYFGIPKGYGGLRLDQPSENSIPVAEVKDAMKQMPR